MAKRYGPYHFWEDSPWCKKASLHCDGFLKADALVRLPGMPESFLGDLREQINHYGLHNSQLIAQMPTASTAHLTGNTESFEPLENVLYVMREISGNFICINERVSALLKKNGLLTPEVIANIKENGGSIQHAPGVPAAVYCASTPTEYHISIALIHTPRSCCKKAVKHPNGMFTVTAGSSVR